MLGKVLRMASLLDVYSSLLTDRQQEICSMYYLSDYSLSEISELKGVSRQAVHDALARSEQAMEDYESKLRLVRDSETRRLQLDALADSLSSVSEALSDAARTLGGAGCDDDSSIGCRRRWDMHLDPNRDPDPGRDDDLDHARACLADGADGVEQCRRIVATMKAGGELILRENHD